MSQLPIPVHVGTEGYEFWDDIEARQREHGEDAAAWLRKQRRPAVSDTSLDWNVLGIEPRWVGSDTADCVAALQPNIFAGHGADEFTRFLRGAAGRGEIALVISPVGDVEAESSEVRSVFGPPTAAVSVGRAFTTVQGRLLGKGATVALSPGLEDADADLARRLMSAGPTLRWRALSLVGATVESSRGTEQHPAEGALLPILETELGEPVVAAWVSPDGLERRYIVPVEAKWSSLLQWMVEQALPEFVPGALRRARRQLSTDVLLMSRGEREARTSIEALDAEYASRKAELLERLAQSEAAATATREGLLYGTGQELVHAVRSVLELSGIEVVDLDAALGGTSNADLLCTYEGMSRLVEVKSASGRASERVYQDLLRHLREWPHLAGTSPVDGGALVINHQHREAPQDRDRRPFERPEFLSAQTELVVATLDLFDAWRDEDSEAVRKLIFGSGTAPVSVQVPVDVEGRHPLQRRGWFRRR